MPRSPKLPKALKIMLHVVAIGILYLTLSGVMFLGLQVNPRYGTIGLIGFFVLLGLYIRFGFKWKKHQKGKNRNGNTT